jgi:phenylacetate-CoA ligase
MLAMQWQLEQTQWLRPAELEARQFTQLRSLLSHAVAHVPHYRSSPRELLSDLSPESFRRWPVLKKSALAGNETKFHAAQLPKEHGRILSAATTGSTGEPVRVAYSDVAQFQFHAHLIRNHLWHRLELSAKLGAINSHLQDGSQDSWSPVTGAAFRTGPAATLDIGTDVDRQLDWLLEERPAYLQTRPSNLRALIARSRENGKAPPSLRAVILQSEMLPAGLREQAREYWNVPLVDIYSCAEFGTLALQCPSHEHYHVQSESAYVEVLRADGSPCAPGETGRVVVTTLQNFAMPLVRYELGDYAEAGAPCPCGRGLPVLKRIVGRMRNMAVDPTGRRFWPSFHAPIWLEVAPVKRIQLVQHASSAIEVRYAMERPLSGGEEDRLRASLARTLAYPYDFSFVRVDTVERKPGEKFEDFISRIPH